MTMTPLDLLVPPRLMNQERVHTQRHIIVEGPDGGGKTQLFNFLNGHLPTIMPYPSKASASTGPVTSQLANWAVRAQRHMRHEDSGYLFDRHPIISELIYGPIIRNGVPKSFQDPSWVEGVRQTLYKTAIVVWCFPPPSVAQRSVSVERDMPGVVENFRAIYQQYLIAASQWQGPFAVWNYTTDDELDLLHTLTKGLVQR